MWKLKNRDLSKWKINNRKATKADHISKFFDIIPQYIFLGKNYVMTITKAPVKKRSSLTKTKEWKMSLFQITLNQTYTI